VPGQCARAVIHLGHRRVPQEEHRVTESGAAQPDCEGLGLDVTPDNKLIVMAAPEGGAIRR
jgi:hypothetical protein